MIHQFKSEFIEIAKSICTENKAIDQWKEIESSDMFQKGIYIGGFDATEMQFTFSLYEDGREFWFQLPLGSVCDVAKGIQTTIEIRPAN